LMMSDLVIVLMKEIPIPHGMMAEVAQITFNFQIKIFNKQKCFFFNLFFNVLHTFQSYHSHPLQRSGPLGTQL